jgi:DNA-binding protein YbaB
MDQAAAMLSVGTAYRAECTAALLDGAREIAAAHDQLSRLRDELDQQQRVRADERWAGESDDGLCRVVCTGTGEVVAVELDPSRYRRVTREQIERAVLAALRQAGGELPPASTMDASATDGGGEPVAEHSPNARVEEIAEQYQQAHRRLASETVSGTAQGGTVTTDYDGLGRLRRLQLSARALTDYDFPGLSRLIVAALQAGGRASAERREQVQDAVVIDGDTVGNWRLYPPDPAAIVRSAFGADLASGNR